MDQVVNESHKKYYTIGEVSMLLGVSTSLLRFWEQKFPHLKPIRNAKGIRKYTATHLTYLRKIHYLVKEKGYTLQGAKAAMNPKTPSHPITNVDEVIEKLKSLKEFLITLKQEQR